VWPWPAPEVDWHTPAERALAAGDCKTAVKILDAATGAGSREAYERLRPLIEGGPCDGDGRHPGLERYVAFTSLFHNEPAAVVYGVDDNDLGAFRHQYVSAAISLCASPYNGTNQIDFVALSSAAPESGNPLMSLHRQRRAVCLDILEAVASQLVDANDKPAHAVAFALTMRPPLTERSQADVLCARLLLEKDYVDDGWSPEMAAHMRDFAWFRLERAAARANNVDAIRYLITFLHQGRERDDRKAYFWVLRLRRLGEEHPLAATIRAGLTAEQMTTIAAREEQCARAQEVCFD
jgi:hypothetical protein